MELKPNCGSDRAWVYSVAADYADEQIRPELLAVKFGNAESKLRYPIRLPYFAIIFKTKGCLFLSIVYV
jgi:RanBP1 domain